MCSRHWPKKICGEGRSIATAGRLVVRVERGAAEISRASSEGGFRDRLAGRDPGRLRRRQRLVRLRRAGKPPYQKKDLPGLSIRSDRTRTQVSIGRNRSFDTYCRRFAAGLGWLNVEKESSQGGRQSGDKCECLGGKLCLITSRNKCLLFSLGHGPGRRHRCARGIGGVLQQFFRAFYLR